jgi:hypothetical protein
MMTVIASIHMTTHRCSPTLSDRIKGLHLVWTQLMFDQKPLAIRIEYVSDITWMPLIERIHSKSMGLLTDGSMAAVCR